jgi:hypothetical protein
MDRSALIGRESDWQVRYIFNRLLFRPWLCDTVRNSKRLLVADDMHDISSSNIFGLLIVNTGFLGLHNLNWQENVYEEYIVH